MIATLVVVVVLGATAACSVAKPAPSPSPKSSVVSSFDEALYNAKRDDNVSRTQLAALETAAVSDAMSYEQISVLLEDTFKCFDESGVDYRRTGDFEKVPGFKMPTYSFGEPLAVAEACQKRFSEYAFEAYQAQPRVGELSDAALGAEKSQVITCLRAHGVTIEDDATLDEIRRASATLLQATSKSSEGVFCTRNL